MDIRFINHASLLIKVASDSYFLTDPWVVSPAFGGWTPEPPPLLACIEALLAVPPSQLVVVISHGHDDHLDEFFIRQHLREATFVVPQFRSPGLARRIERLTGRAPVELTAQPTRLAGATLNAFINADFTQYDAIVTVATESDVVIHANDNWHAYPPQLLEQLNRVLSPYDASRRHLFIQFGVGDCYPLNYPPFDEAAVREVLEQRMRSYQQATTANLAGLGLSHGHYYANQSRYLYPETWRGPSLYTLAQQFLERNPGPFRQCHAGAQVLSQHGTPGAGVDLLRHCLERLRDKLTRLAQPELPLQLLTLDESPAAGTVALQASHHVWARILIGELTLEAVLVGGMGLIHKPPQYNMRELYFRLAKLGYLMQSQVLQDGLRAYIDPPIVARAIPHETVAV